MQMLPLKPVCAMLLLATFFLTAPTTDTALACSTLAFRYTDRPVLAYNFDFEATGSGFLLVNPTGLQRTSVTEGNPAGWSTRFGSVTFNQIGPGMPTAGMNTAGLIVTLMWNSEAAYASRGDAPRVSELEFIQRLLDTASSVAEALETLDDVRIEGLIPIHYFLFDRSGDAAIIAPTADGLVLHQGDDLPIAALTNTAYERAITNFQEGQGTDGTLAATDYMSAEDRNSLGRFSFAADAAQDTMGPMSVADAYAVLDELAHAPTRWQIVFEPTNGRIHLRLKGSKRSFEIDLHDLDYACQPRPLSASFNRLIEQTSDLDLIPIEQTEIAASISKVLGSMQPTADLARPAAAQGIAAGLLASSICTLSD